MKLAEVGTSALALWATSQRAGAADPGTTDEKPASRALEEIGDHYVPDGRYALEKVTGKVNGLHIWGAELRGQPTSGSIGFFHKADGRPCVDVDVEAEFSRSGFRPDRVVACKVPSSEPGKDRYVGEEEEIYMFGEKPAFVDVPEVEIDTSSNEVQATTTRSYNKGQYFGLAAMGLADLATFRLLRVPFGNMGDVFKQDLVHGFSSKITDLNGEIAKEPND